MRNALAIIFLFYAPHVLAAASCSISVPAPINFGVYDAFSSTPNDAGGQVEVCCADTPPPNNVPVTVSLSEGSSGSYSQRKMFNDATPLDYNIFYNVPHTEIWGDGKTDGTSVWTRNIPAGQCRDKDMLGRIPISQNQPPGLYADTITAEVEF